jgi:hypothetical protein
MIEKVTPIDAGIFAAAFVMAVGAFCPIVHLPIVGSITYVMGGRGDGIFVVGAAMAVVGLVAFGYRRLAGVVGIGSLFGVMYVLVGFAATLSKTQRELSTDTGPFGGLSQMLAGSFGLEWGWLLLVGGALAVAILAFLPAGGSIAQMTLALGNDSSDEETSLTAADQRIREYIENRTISPAMRAPSQTTQHPTFGKRHI